MFFFVFIPLPSVCASDAFCLNRLLSQGWDVDMSVGGMFDVGSCLREGILRDVGSCLRDGLISESSVLVVM